MPLEEPFALWRSGEADAVWNSLLQGQEQMRAVQHCETLSEIQRLQLSRSSVASQDKLSEREDRCVGPAGWLAPAGVDRAAAVRSGSQQ